MDREACAFATVLHWIRVCIYQTMEHIRFVCLLIRPDYLTMRESVVHKQKKEPHWSRGTLDLIYDQS